MFTQCFMIIGALLFVALGSTHLLYTFFTGNFNPRDAATTVAMKGTSPVLTSKTTVWQAWIGFNASHSLGAMLFGAVYFVLAYGHMPVLRASPTLAWLAVVGGFAYLALARRYWFRAPMIGIGLATACFLLAVLTI